MTRFIVQILIAISVSIHVAGQGNSSDTNNATATAPRLAEYRELCGAGVLCDAGKFLACGPMGVCECDTRKPSRTYNDVTKRCEEVPEDDEGDRSKTAEDTGSILTAGVGVSYSCTVDRYCQTRTTMGNYSRCADGACECYDTDNPGSKPRNTTLVSGVCRIVRKINETCEHSNDCLAIENAWCATDQVTGRKSCQCELFHFWEWSFGQCLKFARDGLDSVCKSTLQCTAEEGLGPLSRCNGTTSRCECFDTVTNGKNPTVYYEDANRCFQELKLGDHCKIDDECRASLGKNSFCAPKEASIHENHEGHNDSSSDGHDHHVNVVNPGDPVERFCQCPAGVQCTRADEEGSNRPGMSTFTMIFFIVVGAVILIGIVLCFVLRRRSKKRYDAVRQSENN